MPVPHYARAMLEVHEGPIDPTTRDLWQVIAATDELAFGTLDTTLLLDTPIAMTLDRDGAPVVWRRSREQRGDAVDADASPNACRSSWAMATSGPASAARRRPCFPSPNMPSRIAGT